MGMEFGSLSCVQSMLGLKRLGAPLTVFRFREKGPEASLRASLELPISSAALDVSNVMQNTYTYIYFSSFQLFIYFSLVFIYIAMN